MNQKQLIKYIDQFQEQSILVIGDIMLDKYINGSVSRVSEEAPVPIVNLNEQIFRLGGAGNVACNLANLGVKTYLAGYTGYEIEAERIFSICSDFKIDTSSIIKVPGRLTTIKTRVSSRGQQMIRIDKEVVNQVSSEFEEQLLDKINHIEKLDAIIISDYAKGVLTDKLSKKIQELTNDNIFTMLDPKPKNKSLYRNFSSMKPNKLEAEILSGKKITDNESALQVAKELQKEFNLDEVLLSLSSKGLLMLSKNHPEGYYYNTQATEVADVSGAGDTLVSVYTAAKSLGLGEETSAILSSVAASIVVSHIGTSPINKKEFIQMIEAKVG